MRWSVIVLVFGRLVSAEVAAAESVTLQPGSRVEGDLDRTDVLTYTLSLQAGQFVQVETDQAEVGVKLAVFRPDGSLLVLADSATRTGFADSAYILADQTGNYRIEASNDSDDRGGKFHLEVFDPRPAGDRERLRSTAESLFHRGWQLRKTGKPQDRDPARASLRQSLPMFQELGDAVREADCRTYLGDLDLADRRPRDTLEHYRQAIPLLEATGQRVRVGLTWGSLGWAYDNLANFPAALDAHDRALNIFRAENLNGGQATARSSLGRIYQALGAYELALEHHRAAMELWISNGWEGGQGVAWINIGRALDGGGDLQGAITAFENAWNIESLSAKRRGQSSLHLARVHRRIGELGLAAEWLDRSNEIFAGADDPQGQAWADLERGEHHLLDGDLLGAWNAFRESAESFAKMEDPEGQAAGLLGMSRAEHRSGRTGQALDTVDRAIERVEATRSELGDDGMRAIYLSTKREFYDQRIRILLDAEPATDGARLFEAAETARARALLDELIDAAPEAESRALLRPVGVSTVQASLSAGDAVLTYFVADEKVLAFLVTPDEFEWHLMEVDGAALTERVMNFVELLSQESTPELWMPIGIRLGQELLQPLAKTLEQVEHLTVIPDGALHFLPFEALPWDGDWLLRKTDVTYAPSAAVLMALSEGAADTEQPATDAWIFAAPPIEGDSGEASGFRRGWSLFLDDGFVFAPLPFAAQEAREVASILGDRKNLHVGADATEARFKSADLSRAGVLHLATHGWISSKNADRSALLLGADNADSGEDGFLRPSEICALRLNRPLVVLSACESARGPILATEGVQGLARGFLYAGARSVIATLWSVRDEASATFMRAFYEELAGGKSPRSALRAAKLRMLARASTRSPRIWAPYIAIGDASRPIAFVGVAERSRLRVLGRVARVGGLLLLLGLAFVLWRTNRRKPHAA